LIKIFDQFWFISFPACLQWFFICLIWSFPFSIAFLFIHPVCFILFYLLLLHKKTAVPFGQGKTADHKNVFLYL